MLQPGCLSWKTSMEGKRRSTLNKSRLFSKPRKSRFGPAEFEVRKAGKTLLRTLKSGLQVVKTRSEEGLEIIFIDTFNKRKREQPIEEGADEDERAYNEDGDAEPDIDGQAVDVGSEEMEYEQDVYSHSA